MTNSESIIQYKQSLISIMDEIINKEKGNINTAVSFLENSLLQDGIIYIFGTGHSHMLSEEGLFRAGGLAPVTPILSTNLMLHEGATLSSKYERTQGLAEIVLSKYDITSKDSLIIFSNSGVNAVPVEMAIAARKAGLKVIAITSTEYSNKAPLSPVGKKLYEIADVTIDNHIPAGDAIIKIPGSNISCGPASTIIGAFILNSLFAEVIQKLHMANVKPPVYISSNMPNAKENNQKLVKKYKSRNPHL